MEKLHRKACFIKGKNIHIMHWIRFQRKKKWIFIHFYTIRILLESLLRKEDGVDVTKIT